MLDSGFGDLEELPGQLQIRFRFEVTADLSLGILICSNVFRIVESHPLGGTMISKDGLIGVFVATLALCACSTNKPEPAAPPMPSPVSATPASPAEQPKPQAVASPPDYLDPSSAVYRERSVYFGFDDAMITPQYRNVIDVQGHYLATHPSISVRVEGNTDERGSAEYNLALGQKRAQAVVNALKVYGVKDSQMEAVSWGKEKPRALGHDEASWTQNRRADVVYPNQ
jgi:peptidoglycan-associated lipoprotein